jgi:hypothetical protein
MKSFHFDESYAMRRRKHSSFQYAQCPKILKRTIQKKSDLSLNNYKENTHFVIERHSKQETNPSKPKKKRWLKETQRMSSRL